MSSPNQPKQGWLKQVFNRIFMESAAIPPFLQYFMTLFEFFIFTIFVSSNSLIGQSLIFSDVIQRNMIIFLGLLFLLRYLTRLSIIKSIFVMLLVWNVQCQLGILSIIVYILLLIHIIIDIISKMEFSFETKNVHVSTYPWLIVIHYISMSSLTVLRFLDLKQKFIFPLCEIGAVLLMLILQERALYKYVDFKNIQIRFYFLTALYALAEIYQIFISPQPLWKSVFAIIASQLLHQFVKWKFRSDFTLQEYISKKLQTEAGFFIFSFLYSKKQVDKMIIKALKTLANEDTNVLMEQKTFKEVQVSIIKKALNEDSGQFINYINETKQASHRLIALIRENPSIYSQLLIAELTLFELDQHVNCREKLMKLYSRTKWYNILARILIKKLEKKLLAHLRIEHNKRSAPMFYEFIENDRFRNMLLKSAVNFVELWQYTKVKEGIYKRINQLAEKVINGQDKIYSFYKELKVKCIKINLLYGSYLFLVERDIVRANQIMQQLYFYQQKQENIECDNKIFIKVSIQFSEPLRVEGIGSNVNKHLGYEKRTLIGLAASNLVPEFYKDDHDKIMADVLEKEPQKMFLYSKSTIIKHAKGNYVVSLFCLRITYDIDGSLSSQGFIKIIQDQRHNWHNFLFVRNSTREIVQCSGLVNQKISNTKGKRYSAQQFFDNIGQGAYWTRIQKYTSQLNSYYYQPILEFDSNNEKVTMFVELDPYAQSIIVHKPSGNGEEKQRQQPTKRKILIPQMIVYPKYKVFDNIKHFLRLKISSKRQLTSLRNKIITLVFIMSTLLIGIYIIQGINIINVHSQYNTKIQTMEIIDNILNHYMGLNKIAVDLSYLVVNQNYGYTFPNYNITLGKDIMTVQATNLYFKPYSINTWPYESLSTTQLYHTCYEFVSQFLAAALFIDQVSDDQQIRDNMLSSYGKIFTQTFLWTYSQYTERIHDQLAISTQNSDIYQIIKIVILAIIAVVLYLFIIKIENSIRVTEHQTLQFISSLTFQDQMIQKTKQFIHLITEEKVETLITSSKGSFGGMGGGGTKDSYPESSKISELSARESTGRDFLGNMSGRDTIRTADNPQIQTTDQLLAQNSRIKLKPVNKKFILLPLVFLLAILLLQIFNYVINVKLKEIDESQSEQNIVSWMNKPLFFTRLLNAFLTEDRGPGITDHDSTFYKAYNSFQSSYNNVASFSQTSYTQFLDFSVKLREIQFEYLCTYAACPSFDADYVNILYTTTMQKLAQYMLSNLYFLDDPNNKMNTIIISEQLFRQIMTDLIQTYISDYQQYANDYQSSQMMFFIIILVVLGLLSLLLGLQIYFNVYKSFVKHFKIYDIVKENSYLINKEEMISFQEELKRQQTEKKNKQGKKKKKTDQDKEIDESRDEQNQNSQNLENHSKDVTGRYSPRSRGQSKISKGSKMKDRQESKVSAFKQQKQKMKKTSSK